MPEGITGEMGEPSVWPRVRWVEAAGASAALFGEATVWFRNRTLAVEGSDAQIHGSAMVAHARRWLLARGAQLSSEGVPAVANADRTIAPAAIFERFATWHAIGWARTLRPDGFDATRWGARIIPESQSAYPHGFGTLFGLATTYNLKQQVRPQAITTYRQPEERWGRAHAFNLVQYIEQRPITGSGLEAPEWAQTWTGIANRNRRAPLQGFVASRFGYAQIDNNARQILPNGAAPQDPAPFYKAGMVSHRIRSLSIDGMEPPYISSWVCAFNKAFTLNPSGAIATLFGAAGV